MNRRNFSSSSSSSSGASSSSNFNRGERQRPKAPSSLPPLTARTVRQVADGMLDAAKRFERLFQKLPPGKVRIDFRPTFLVYRRDDDVVAGCPAAFYHLGHLLRIAGSETDKEAWPRILAVRYPGSGGDAAAAAETLAVGPDNRKYPLSGYAHGFDAAREDLPAVADSVQPHNRHVVNWHTGAMRLAKSLHLHDINVLTNWMEEHQDIWGADPSGSGT